MHKKRPCRAGNHFIERASSGRDRNLPSKMDPQLTMLALLAHARFDTLWLCLSELLQKRSQPLTSRPSTEH